MSANQGSFDKLDKFKFRFPTMTSGDWDKRQNALRQAVMHGSYTTGDDIKAGYGQPSRDLQFIKARQDDYWNKITLYNQKIHALEVQEAALKKKRDQMQLRQLLTE